MDTIDSQVFMRIFFAKLANDLGVKYKIPKVIKKESFNVSLKNFRMDSISIEYAGNKKYDLFAYYCVTIEKTISELLDDYGYFTSGEDKSYLKFCRFYRYGDFVKMDMPYTKMSARLYDEDICYIGDHFSGNPIDMVFIEGKVYQRDGFLFVHKDYLDKVYMFFKDSDGIHIDIDRLLEVNLATAFSKFVSQSS